VNRIPGSPQPVGSERLLELVATHRERHHGCRILDLRRTDTAPADHLPGSAWIPWSESVPVFLMPPRGEPVVVVARPGRARELAARLTVEGWPASWASEELPPSALAPGPPGGAAWDVDPLLRRHLDRLPPPGGGPVLDLGSGSSREGVFLAQRGYDVLVLDRLPDALDLARARARHHGVGLRTLHRRIRRARDLPDESFGVVLDLRFLCRPVLDALAAITRPGGMLLLRCYGSVEPGQEVGRGPRNPRERLGVDEARRRLGAGWEWIEEPRSEREDGAVWVRAVGRRGDE
jgi:SAM-dependent methyltransferase